MFLSDGIIKVMIKVIIKVSYLLIIIIPTRMVQKKRVLVNKDVYLLIIIFLGKLEHRMCITLKLKPYDFS